MSFLTICVVAYANQFLLLFFSTDFVSISSAFLRSCIFALEDSSKEQYVKLAIPDGHQYFLSKGTLKNMTIVADMCQKFAKLPEINKYGPHFVRDKHHPCQAIDYLYYGNRLGDPGSCICKPVPFIILFD
jgi:hypothetical protein